MMIPAHDFAQLARTIPMPTGRDGLRRPRVRRRWIAGHQYSVSDEPGR